MLRIAFDAKRALNNVTGLGNYSRLVIEAIAGSGIDAELLLMTAPGATLERVGKLLAMPNVRLEEGTGFAARHMQWLWRSRSMVGDLRRLRPDIYHGLSNELPLDIEKSGIPSVVTIHDLIWRRFPSDYTAIDRRLYDMKYGRSARAATRVIAISECTRRDIISDFGVDPDRIDVIYQGCDSQFAPASAGEIARVRSLYGIGDNPYVIAVGTVQGRKNQLLAVKGLRALPQDVRLVIVGRRTAYARDIDAYVSAHPGLAERILWLEGIPFGDLPALYSGALFSTYTSFYEGFGIPLVESLRCGVPVIAATGSCLEEAGGPGALYVAPHDADAWADAARMLTEDKALRGRMVCEGQAHCEAFDNASFADNFIRTYRKALTL